MAGKTRMRSWVALPRTATTRVSGTCALWRRVWGKRLGQICKVGASCGVQGVDGGRRAPPRSRGVRRGRTDLGRQRVRRAAAAGSRGDRGGASAGPAARPVPGEARGAGVSGGRREPSSGRRWRPTCCADACPRERCVSLDRVVWEEWAALARVLGITPEAVYREAQRGRQDAERWQRLLKG